MTDEKFSEIYTNKKLRNEVAYAHGCYDSYMQFKYKSTCGWPVEYIVTDDQIEKAKKELERSAAETKERYKNSLLFIGMGMTYETETDIGNHRIRTEFLNRDGRRFFVEFGTARNRDYMRCDHSIEYVGDESRRNFANLERYSKPEGICRYTPEEVLKLVNKKFDCNFTEIFIDNYDLSCEGVMCESPK